MKSKSYKYVIRISSTGFELLYVQPKRNDEFVFNSFEEGKQMLLAFIGDMVTHYQLLYTAWAATTRQELLSKK